VSGAAASLQAQAQAKAQAQARQLCDIARASAPLMQALRAARTLQLPDWCIGAGTLRNLVWDHLQGRHGPPAHNPPADLDLAYFDPHDLSPERDAALQARLDALAPGIPWEVTNQAGVHLWFEARFGHPVAPLQSLDEALASWPEYATAVGLRLDADDRLRVIAPLGLDDLFAMVVRRNPRRVSLETYRQRVAAKRYAERWPRVRVIHE
jgi:hypothetical protein